MPQDKAQKFIEANKASPVVSVEVVGMVGEGATFVLADRRRFKLTAAECEMVGKPRWSFDT